jgi:uncharacterized protein (TIGR00255 family)
MTGRGEGTAPGCRYSVQIRSVNHKGLDLRVRMPTGTEALEQDVARRVRERLARGHVEVTVELAESGAPAGEVRVDLEYARSAAETLRKVRDALGLPGDVTLEHLMQVPGVIESAGPKADPDSVRPGLLAALDAAIDSLDKMRGDEGRALAAVIAGMLDRIGRNVEAIRAGLPAAMAAYEERLRRRVADLSAAADAAYAQGRLEAELALLADRCDVSEELARLDSHMAQAGTAMAGTEPCGRKLDFLAVEMNRELSTVCAKAPGTGAAASAVEAKIEVEKLREQAANLE